MIVRSKIIDDQFIPFVTEDKLFSPYVNERIRFGWGNGYVTIPKIHPCYEMHFQIIHQNYDIDVFGGLTFSDYGEHLYLPEDVNKDKISKMWVVGFDTAHYQGGGLFPTKQEVMQETIKLRDQLIKIGYGLKL